MIFDKQGDTYWCCEMEGTNPRTVYYNDLELAQEGILLWEKAMDPRRTDSELETEYDYYGPLSQEQRKRLEEHTRWYPIRQRRYVRHLTQDPCANRYEEVEYQCTDDDDS